MARGASLRYTRRTPIRGIAPHPWGGPKQRSRCAFEGGWMRRCRPAPPPWPLQVCTTAGERSGGDGVRYVLFHTSLSLRKVPPVSPANLPRVTRRWHRSRWERGGGGETRKLMLRSLRSPWFLFLVPLLMPSLQSPSKILSNLNYWEGRLFNTGKELKEKKSSADTSNEANVPSGFIPCLSGKKINPSPRQRGYPRAPLLTRWEGWREDESWGKQKPEAEASRTGSII